MKEWFRDLWDNYGPFIMFGGPLVLLAGFVGVVFIVSLLFGNSGVRLMKDIRSDFGSLERDVAVINSFTGDTLFKHSGPCYFENEGAKYNQGIALIYEQDGKTLKANFAGEHIIFVAVEK